MPGMVAVHAQSGGSVGEGSHAPRSGADPHAAPRGQPAMLRQVRTVLSSTSWVFVVFWVICLAIASAIIPAVYRLEIIFQNMKVLNIHNPGDIFFTY